MNPLYEKIAKAIRMNTLILRSRSTGGEDATIDKNGLVEALSNYFKKTDALFNPAQFEKACDEIEKEDQ